MGRITSMGHLGPGALETLVSAVSSVTRNASARATYAALNRQHRCPNRLGC